MGVFVGMYSIDDIIRAHQCPRRSLPYGDFKWLEVGLSQGTFCNYCIVCLTLRLLLVAYEVLDGRSNIFALQPTDVRGCQFSSKERVLGKGFLMQVLSASMYEDSCKDSCALTKLRPPKGDRCMQIVGASRTFAPLAFVSSPRC